MISKHLSTVLAVFLLGLTVDNGATKRNSQLVNRSQNQVNSGGVYKVDCTETDESGNIGIALRHLSSGEYQQIRQARNTLLSYAHQSSHCRKEVVRALIEGMDRPNLDFERQLSNYYLWREGSQLLGELKATEALDLLISHLDMTNGFHSASMVFQPAIQGVRQMGQAAIPKLVIALRQDPKARLRLAAAYCLTDIGGKSAMDALRQARDGETNQCVANFIRISLNTFSYKSKNGFSFDNEAPQATTDARRSWLMAFECSE
jgi:hypothetical protein